MPNEKVVSIHLSADLTESAQVTRALSRVMRAYTRIDHAVLIQIPQVPTELMELKTAKNRGYFAYPPQSLFYLSAVFEEQGVTTTLVDLNFATLKAAQLGADASLAWQNEVDLAIECILRPLICISFMFDSTWPQLRAVVDYVKKKYPHSAVAVGGVGATADPDRVLKIAGADLVFSNEGEGPLREFISYVNKKNSIVPSNLSVMDEDGNICATEMKTGGVIDLDIRSQYRKLPLRDYHLIGSLNNFSRMRGVEIPYATVISRRGCRAKCTFCAVRNFNGRKVRVRDSHSVVEEMQCLVEDHGIRHFDWLDDDLLFDHDSAVELFRKIAVSLPGISWAAHNGLIASAVTSELMDAMQNSGCIGFDVGLETGNRELLRKVRKPITIDQFYAFAELSKAYPKMYYLVNIILGLPTETFSQMLDSFNVVANARLDWTNFFTYQPLKNTDAYVVYGGLDDNSYDEDILARGTTMNFNPARGGSFREVVENNDIKSGYDVFDLDPGLQPNKEQCKEIWFTFNAITNFLKMPALTTENEDRLRNGIQWMGALSHAYEDNPSIDCVLYYLRWRLNDISSDELEMMRNKAHEKFSRSEYWRYRDSQFNFSVLLDKQIPQIAHCLVK